MVNGGWGSQYWKVECNVKNNFGGFVVIFYILGKKRVNKGFISCYVYYKAKHLFKHASVWRDSILWKRRVSLFELTPTLYHTRLYVLKL